jgi:hypothetical protein
MVRAAAFTLTTTLLLALCKVTLFGGEKWEINGHISGLHHDWRR